MFWNNPVNTWRGISDRYQHLGKQAQLITWTVIDAPPLTFTWQKKYIVGLLELEAGTKVMAQLVGVSVDKLSQGQVFVGVLRKLYTQGDEGVITYGVKFKLLD